MRKLLKYLITFSQEHISWKSLIFIVLSIAAMVLGIYLSNFDKLYIKSTFGKPERYFWTFLIEAVPFLWLAFSSYFHKKDMRWFFKKGFWLRFFFGFGILAISRSDSSLTGLVDGMSGYERLFAFRLLWSVKDLFYVFIPLIVFYYFFERERDLNWYGCGLRSFDMKPYLFMLAVMLFVVGFGSFLADLQAYYPKYDRSGGPQVAEAHGYAEWILVVVYELFYGSDFFNVEFFFRGFLVLAFARYMGGYAVIAMVGAYVTLHSGKPVSEMISSAFGGYALGVIVYYTRSMWGGVMVHVGIAWMMELFGYLQK